MKIMLIGTYHRGKGIDEEFKKIKEPIRTNHNISTEYCTSPSDFSHLIQEQPFDIIHISTDAKYNGIIELPNIDNENKTDLLNIKELASFFKNATAKYVVLNFCYSKQVADLITNDIQYVIGIDGDIERTAAVEFSKEFYGSLGGSPLDPIIIDRAFEKGRNAALPRTGNIDRYKKLKNLRYIALKAHNGKYVSAKGHSGNDVVADAEKIDTWEKFQLMRLEGRKVALLAHNGQFVCADQEAGYDGKIVANRNKRDTWETFEWNELEGSKVTLRAYNDKYVCADPNDGGKLIANRPDMGDEQKFSFQYVPN